MGHYTSCYSPRAKSEAWDSDNMNKKNSITARKRASFKYAQIKTDLSLKILNGELSPGERIPSQNEMAEQYGVSTITTRRVLNDLATEGLIHVIRGKGSFVAKPLERLGDRRYDIRKEVGVVFGGASGVFMHDIIQGIDAQTFELGIHINLFLSQNS